MNDEGEVERFRHRRQQAAFDFAEVSTLRDPRLFRNGLQRNSLEPIIEDAPFNAWVLFIMEVE